MPRRFALLIGTSSYTDSGLKQLLAPAQDIDRLARVLRDPAISGFEVLPPLLNQNAADVKVAVEEALMSCGRDDLIVLYLSGHGVKDFLDGHLYLAATDTRLNLLESTAISAEFLNKVMLRSPARQQVLLLDCCYGGAFARGMTVKAGDAVNALEQFSGADAGQGRAIITASDAMQFALEGEIATGKGVQSVFTQFLAEGLETGAADLDADGSIELRELYDYVLARMKEAGHPQRPNGIFAQAGKLYLARNPHPPAPKPKPLPPEIAEALADPRPFVRVGAVDELARLLRGNDPGLALAARQALERVRDDEDQIRRVAEAATRALASAAPQASPAMAPLVETRPKPNPDRLKLTVPFELDLIRIPAGEFLMGSDQAEDEDAYDDELPQHRLSVAEFYMARTPVTVAQFSAFGKAAGYTTQAEKDGFGWVWNRKGGADAKWDKANGANWQHPGGPHTSVARKSDHPVTQVSWHDARAFADWLNHVAVDTMPAGWKFRLPTEAEWEKAARGTDGRKWPWGNTWDVSKCNCDNQIGDTTPVGKYSPAGDSPYGCVDMIGNVWEWTVSLWGNNLEKPDYKYPYNSADGRENLNAPDDVFRVLRGGSFYYDRRLVRCACRIDRSPPVNRFDYYGFRVVLREASPG